MRTLFPNPSKVKGFHTILRCVPDYRTPHCTSEWVLYNVLHSVPCYGTLGVLACITIACCAPLPH